MGVGQRSVGRAAGAGVRHRNTDADTIIYLPPSRARKQVLGAFPPPLPDEHIMAIIDELSDELVYG